jgi:hypothetical protein
MMKIFATGREEFIFFVQAKRLDPRGFPYLLYRRGREIREAERVYIVDCPEDIVNQESGLR